MTLKCDKNPVRLVTLSLFCALSIVIFVLESFISIPIPIPGIKLGLSNIITLFLLTKFKKHEVVTVIFARIVIGSLLSGQLVGFLFSLIGGLLALISMAVTIKLAGCKNLWFVGVVGAIFHNVGQVCVAVILYKSVYFVYYFFILAIAGLFTGLITGIIASSLAKFIKIET